jgi:DNA-binding IclR family transcriptional regulator
MFLTQERLRVKDVADTLEVATGTAHRLLAMLQYRGFVAQDPVTRIYMPGSVLLSLGLRSAQGSELRQIARPHMAQLHHKLDETISLATLQGDQVFYVDSIESSKTLKVSSRAGTYHPAHCTSVGKALLADLTREQLLELYPQPSLPRVTSRSVTSRRQLFDELEASEERGYAINRGELEEGIGSVACAIRDRSGRAIAAVGAGAPMSRLNERRMAEFAKALAATAAAIGNDLSA